MFLSFMNGSNLDSHTILLSTPPFVWFLCSLPFNTIPTTGLAELIKNRRAGKKDAPLPESRLQEALPARMPSLTKEEINVLVKSSQIASGFFLPFSQDEIVALAKRNSSMEPTFTDDSFDLRPAPKQVERLAGWLRPNEIVALRKRTSFSKKISMPTMIQKVSPYSIEQRCVTDCSFVASLCVCAAFEKRFNRRIVTSIIYPQDKNGTPVVSKTGEYVVKLWCNGVARRVTVDDRLPVDRRGNLLCSQTTLPAFELWVSIIEKATTFQDPTAASICFLSRDGSPNGYSFPNVAPTRFGITRHHRNGHGNACMVPIRTAIVSLPCLVRRT